jgi:hypothetical protein
MSWETLPPYLNPVATSDRAPRTLLLPPEFSATPPPPPFRAKSENPPMVSKSGKQEMRFDERCNFRCRSTHNSPVDLINVEVAH